MTRGDIALYVWDYFFISHVPARGDEARWAVIERATCRIRESESRLDAPDPPDVRLRSARRVRNAARLARRQIDLLSSQPARWVIDGLAELEAEADDLLRTLADAARRLVVH